MCGCCSMVQDCDKRGEHDSPPDQLQSKDSKKSRTQRQPISTELHSLAYSILGVGRIASDHFSRMDGVGVVKDCKQILGMGKRHRLGFSLNLLQIF